MSETRNEGSTPPASPYKGEERSGDEVLKRLKADAQRHRRSLNQELIGRLESSASSVPLDPEDFLAQVRGVRVTPRKGRLTDRVLNRLKTQGRP